MNERFSPEHWPKPDLDRYLDLESRPPWFGVPSLRTDGAATSSKGMIAGTSNPVAIHAGLEVLTRGGNAADAALTTALAQIALTAGSAISYAGIMTVVYFDAASEQVHTLNAGYNTVKKENDPLTIPVMGQPSGRTALVPGFMAGVQALHDRFGKLPFSSLFAPAIWVAERGVPVSPMVAGLLVAQRSFITRLPETKQIFTKPDGRLYAKGEAFQQLELAETLKRVAAHGSGYMYTGEWARHLVQSVQREGGKMTLEDLADYRPMWTEPLQVPYRGYQVVSLGSPNNGGLQTLASLKLVEVADLKKYGHYASSVDALYYLMQVSRIERIFANAPESTLKTLFADVDPSPDSRLTAQTAQRLWARIQRPGWWQEAQAHAQSARRRSNHSAGVLAVDEHGNVAAMLHSCNCLGWGSTGVFVDGVSIPDSANFQQRRLADIGPGVRLPEGTNPLIVLKSGKPVLASTTIGSSLHEATLQNLINVLDFGMDPKTAVDQPNSLGPFYGLSATGPAAPEFEKEALSEGAFSDTVIEGVRARGQAIKIIDRYQQLGYWIGISIDPVTGMRTGGVTSRLPALVEGY